MNFFIKLVLLLANSKLLQDYSSAYYITQITTVNNPKESESFFISYILSNTIEDPVCSLSEEKKQALCEQIFQLPLFRKKGVYFNTVAFFVNKPLCKRNPVKLSLLSLFVDEIIKQEMYPCYGRHDPVGTDYKTDTHYDKFYISTGLYENSVIVYIHKYDIDSDWYSVFSYHEKVRLSELKDFIINIKDVRAELEFNQIIRSTNDRKLLEYIYIRRNDKNNKKDSAVCKLDVSRKATLCEIIFSQYRYKTYFSIELNKAVIVQVKNLICHKKRVTMVYSKRYQNLILEQYLYPCPSKNRLTSDNLLKENNTHFYVSEGSWKNSVFIYYRRKTFGDEQFFLMELLENVCIDCLKPSNITIEDIRQTSVDTYLEMKKMTVKLLIIERLILKKIDIITSMVWQNIKVRQKAILAKYPTGLANKILHDNKTIYVNIGSTVVGLLVREEHLKYLAYIKKHTSFRMMSDIDLLTKLSDEFSAELLYIDQLEKNMKNEKPDEI